MGAMMNCSHNFLPSTLIYKKESKKAKIQKTLFKILKFN